MFPSHDQTLSQDHVLESVNRFGEITHIIVDEAHRVAAETYGKILDYWPDSRTLCVTATPIRLDKLDLSKLFGKLSYRYGITKAISEGVLCPFYGLEFELPIVYQNGDEGDDGENQGMGKLLSADNIMQIVFEKWKEHASDRLTIGFTSSVAQAHAYAEYFNAQGIPSIALDGSTPKGKRKKAIRQFSRGEYQIIFNCNMFIEGFNVPAASCLLQIKPTRSNGAYVQMVGRILRKLEGKEDVLILDFTPAGNRDFVMAGSLFGKERKEKQEKEPSTDVLLIGNAFAITRDGLGIIDPYRS